MAHTKRQKEKVRKSDLSLQNKTRDLGGTATSSACLCTGIQRGRWDTAMHVPRGQRVPDLNRIVCLHVPVTYRCVGFIPLRC